MYDREIADVELGAARCDLWSEKVQAIAHECVEVDRAAVDTVLLRARIVEQGLEQKTGARGGAAERPRSRRDSSWTPSSKRSSTIAE